jgi:hypothetical protein
MRSFFSHKKEPKKSPLLKFNSKNTKHFPRPILETRPSENADSNSLKSTRKSLLKVLLFSSLNLKGGQTNDLIQSFTIHLYLQIGKQKTQMLKYNFVQQ